jgi:hypothetical protein
MPYGILKLMMARHGLMVRGMAATVLLVALAASSMAQPQFGASPTLEAYLAHLVRLQPAERRTLLTGAPITRVLPAEQRSDVAVLGAIWIAAPIHRYVDAVNDIERLKSAPGFKVVKRISDPPALADFSRFRLPDEDFAALRRCRVGDCDVKLDEQTLRQLRTHVNWRASDARASTDALIRQLALGYVNGYLDGGYERLPVYRDQAQPVSVGAELRDMIGRMPSLDAVPDVRRFMLEFPSAPAPHIASFVYWQEAEFGLKPTISIHHVTIREAADATVVATKMLYASHYFWTGIELRTLLPDPARGAGFWFVTVTRSRSDGLGGFTGTFIRRRVVSVGRNTALSELRATKRLMEAH